MRPEHRELLSVLVKALNNEIMDYYYFPEVVYVGRQRIERILFDRMLSEAFIREVRRDAFGRFFTLTPKAQHLIYEQLISKHTAKRKKTNTRYVQTSLCFC